MKTLTVFFSENRATGFSILTTDSTTGKRIADIARRIARKRANRWLEERYGLTVKRLDAKILAAELRPSLEEIAT